METVWTTPWLVMAWPTARTSLMRNSPTVVSGTFFFLLQNSSSHILVVDICNASPHHFLSGPQPTACVRRVTDGVWMAAVWGIAPGATGRTTAETILMKSSATVSRVFWLNKCVPPAVRWYFQMMFYLNTVSYFLCLSATLCSADQFQCRDGGCISNSSKCNQKVDCEDASDEMNCSKFKWWDSVRITKCDEKSQHFLPGYGIKQCCSLC